MVYLICMEIVRKLNIYEQEIHFMILTIITSLLHFLLIDLSEVRLILLARAFVFFCSYFLMPVARLAK